MPKSKIIVALGALIAVMPQLGFPGSWESFFVTVLGLAIVLVSVWTNIDKRLTLKAKAQKRQAHKRLQVEMEASKQISQEALQESELSGSERGALEENSLQTDSQV